jgi:hypothetical protein
MKEILVSSKKCQLWRCTFHSDCYIVQNWGMFGEENLHYWDINKAFERMCQVEFPDQMRIEHWNKQRELELSLT